jgi:glycosyltransferase involved in cell wall biosynthesis
MRILHISSARTFGGGERHVVDLCRGLAERGHDVFAALRPTSLWQDRLDLLPSANKLFVSIRNSFGVLSAMRIAEFVHDNNIDIVHAHVARDYIPASIACLAARPSKLVLTRHVLFPLKPFNKFALKNVSRVIAVSNAVGVEMNRIFPAEKVAVIPNGMDVPPTPDHEREHLRREFRRLHGIPIDAPVIGTLGELKSLKGQREFVAAAVRLAAADAGSRFVIVGQDNTDRRKFLAELRSSVASSGLADRFVWLDWLADTSSFFAAIDLFVSPSHSESFGLAILEAMARGKAIVATETEGAKQLLAECGRLVPIGDVEKLAEAVIGLFRDPAKMDELGKQAMRTALEEYSLERMVDATERLYEEIVTSSDAAAP